MSSDWVNKNQIFLTLTPAQLLALTGYGEAGKEGDAGIIAVMNVVKNRTRDTAHKTQFVDSEILTLTGSLYHAVILRYKQFSMYNLNDPVRPKAERFAELWSTTVTDNSYVRNCYQLSQKVINGSIGDNTQGATFYHAASVTPSWASSIPYLGQIGNHLFYGVQEAAGMVANVVTGVAPSPLGWVVLMGIGGLMLLWYFTRKGGARNAQYN